MRLALPTLLLLFAGCGQDKPGADTQTSTPGTTTTSSTPVTTTGTTLPADSDGDGLSDDEEALLGTDPSLTDTDGDGLSDGDEVNVYGSDPLLADTDGDYLIDGDEVMLYGTDATLVDSDGGGASDGDEVQGFGTDPLDSTDDVVCAAISVDNYDPGAVVTGGPMDVRRVGVSWKMGLYRGEARDFGRDINGDGVAELFSGTVTFSLYDAGENELCTVVYDASDARSVVPSWTTNSGGTLYAAWTLDGLRDGVTDCDAVDPAMFGVTDLRDAIEAKRWGVALGDLVNFYDQTRAEVAAVGGNFAANWAPYVLGGYVTHNGRDATEVGYAFTFETTCDVLDLLGPEPIRLPALSGPPGNNVIEATAFFTFDAREAFLPVPEALNTCAEAQNTPPMTTGDWYVEGEFVGFTNDMDAAVPGPSCTGWTSPGLDAIYPVRLQPGEEVSVEYLSLGDSSIYFVETCGDTNTCVAGADNAQPERLSHVNNTGAVQDLSMVVDCHGADCGFYQVSVTVETYVPRVPLVAADSCAEAYTVAPLSTGMHKFSGSNAGYLSNRNMLFGNICTGWESEGGDAWIGVVVPVGQRVEVNYRSLFDDGSLYLSSGCADQGVDCLAGSDFTGVSGIESLSYDNVGATQKLVFVGLDCFTPSCGDYEVDIEIY